MGQLLKQVFLIISYLFASTTLSSAFYCDWGQCEAWEYCCKEGVCCTETDPFLLVYLIFVSLVLFIICGGCMYYGSQYIRMLRSSNKYNIMEPEV